MTALPMGTRLIRLSRICFYLLLFLLPWIARWELQQRQAFGLAPEYVSMLFYVLDVPLLFTVVTWLLANFIDPARTIHLAPWPVTVPLLALVGLSLASILWSLAAAVATEFAVRLLLLLALYLFVTNEIQDYRWPVLALAGGAVLQAIVALGQFLAGSSLGLGFLGEMELDAWHPSATVIQIGSERWLRGFGLSPSPNILGGILGLALFALLGWGLQSRRGRPIGWLIGLGLVTAGLVSTFSRSAWLGIGGGLLVTAGLLWRARDKQSWPAFWRLLAVGVGVGGAFLAVYPQLFLARLAPAAPVAPAESSLETLDLAQRAAQEWVAWTIVERYPLGGVGIGNFGLAASLLGPPAEGMPAHQPVHNAGMLLTSELGLGGGALWLVLGLVLAVGLWQNRARIGAHPWLLAWSGALVAVGIASNFDHYLFTYQQGRLLLWVTLGLWAGAARRAGLTWRWPVLVGPAGRPEQALRKLGTWVGLGLVLLLAAGVGVGVYRGLIVPRGTLLWDPAGFAWAGWRTLAGLRAGDWSDLGQAWLLRSTYPPGYPLLQAGVFAAFGGSEIVARSFSLVTFLAAVVLLYWLGRMLAPAADDGPLTGVLAAMLALGAPILLYTASDVQLEPAGLVLTLAALLCACRAADTAAKGHQGWLAAAGILTTITLLTKYNYGLVLLLGLWSWQLLSGAAWANRRWSLLTLAATTVLPAALWFLTDVGRLSTLIAFAVNRSSGLSVWQEVAFYPLALLRDYAGHWSLGAIALLTLGAALACWRRWDSRVHLVLLTALAGVALAVLHPYKQARFLYTVAPLLLLPAALWGGRAVGAWAERGRWGRPAWRRWAGSVALVALLLGGQVLGMPAALRRYQEGENERLNYAPAEQITLDEMLVFVTGQTEPGQVVLVNGCFDEFSVELLRWTWRQDPGRGRRLYSLPFVGYDSRQRRQADADLAPYVRSLEGFLETTAAQSVVSIAVQPDSPFYTTDYANWNAWQGQYDQAMQLLPQLKLVREAGFDQDRITVRVYQVQE